MVLIILIFVNRYSYSAKWKTEGTVKVTILKKIELPSDYTYSSFDINGASKSNIDKYSTIICSVNKIDKNKLEEQKVFCNAFVSDGYKYSSMQIRKKTNTDVGVGKTIILSGPGSYKKLANKKFDYAVSYLKDHALVTTKYSVTDKNSYLLKN